MIKLTQVKMPYCKFDLTVSPQQRVAIIGPSGAGKSTLLNIIAGFIELNTNVSKEEGSLYLEGANHTFSLPGERPVSMLFQSNNLIEHLSVFENIAIGIKPTLRLTSDERNTLLALAEKMQLVDLLNRIPEQLSGGQQQRVALARSLLRKKPILLLDEPFSALDSELRFEMLSLLVSIHRENNLTTLMVTHNDEDIKAFADRVIQIKEGNIVSDELL
ncbi:thiamine ABC transporter ATP-binding protein [Thorsellia kenyensis]|uniref:Thiamine ABC transporter ATP-binding protein n=1 Tax=Thorsellia kenyensis TaxID=1549888 RepID=A0ABV6CDI4_9GAMM